MAEIKSQGLIGLPHFRNSRASVEMYEPLYNNIFTVQIQLPTKIGSTVDNTNLLLESVLRVGGLDTNKMPGVVEQHYKYATRSYAGAAPDNTAIDVTLDFEVNLQATNSNGQPSAYVLKTLRKWTDLIYDPLTGRTGLKKDYVAPSVTITRLDRAQNPYHSWVLYNVFPTTAITVPTLDFTDKEIYRITGWTLRCDYWDEVIL